jgi:PAS domain S-box-containing protein
MVTDSAVSVLVVEDEPAHAEAIRRALEGAEMKAAVHVVGTLQEYQDVVAARPPDIAILDLFLPDGRALDALTFLPEASPFPILVMTSFGNEQIAVAAMKAGALDYVVKSPEAFATMPHTIVRALLEWNMLQERKQREEELAQATREWQTTFDAVNDVIWLLDKSNRILRSNRVAERFFGRSYGELIGRNCCPIVHGSEKPLPACPILRARKSLSRETQDILVGEKWVEVTVDPILDAAGRYAGAVHIISDITERKRMEKELSRAEENFRHSLENSPLGVRVVTADGDTLYANKAILDFYGYDSLEELKNTPIKKRYTPESFVEFTQRKLRRQHADPPLKYEISIVKKNGEVRVLRVFRKDVLWDGRKQFLALYLDITEQRKVAEELEQSYQKLQRALKSIIQAIVLTSETRDPYTAGHQQRVARLACAIAQEMGLSKEKIEVISIAGNLHDIGKISVPSEILSKPGRLSEMEMGLVKTHPQVGHDILKILELPWAICPIVLQHHERMEGSGYPAGLFGKDIELEARIMAVADVVEAMASHRPYRPALGIDKALEEITQGKGRIYDADVVDACLRLFNEKGFELERATSQKAIRTEMSDS